MDGYSLCMNTNMCSHLIPFGGEVSLHILQLKPRKSVLADSDWVHSHSEYNLVWTLWGGILKITLSCSVILQPRVPPCLALAKMRTSKFNPIKLIYDIREQTTWRWCVTAVCVTHHLRLLSSPSGCDTPAVVHMTAWINCLLYWGMNLFSQRDIRLDEIKRNLNGENEICIARRGLLVVCLVICML